MKLSELVRLKQSLQESLVVQDIEQPVDQLILSLEGINQPGLPEGASSYLRKTQEHYRTIKNQLQLPYADLKVALEEIDKLIEEQARVLFAASYELHFSSDVDAERQGRREFYTDETLDLIKGRIRMYSDWHFPALEIGPGDGEWTEFLVQNDPLYLLDIRQEFLDSTLSRFNDVYKNRIRPYLIDMHQPPDLSVLPQSQFGFVFSFNVFNYFPLERVKEYLTEVWKCLKPGGVFVFSYNNGERWKSADLAEKYVRSYIPKSVLVTLAETMGYEVLETFDCDETISWIELQRPGVLKTVKAHQAMGEIKSIGT